MKYHHSPTRWPSTKLRTVGGDEDRFARSADQRRRSPQQPAGAASRTSPMMKTGIAEREHASRTRRYRKADVRRQQVLSARQMSPEDRTNDMTAWKFASSAWLAKRRMASLIARSAPTGDRQLTDEHPQKIAGACRAVPVDKAPAPAKFRPAAEASTAGTSTK